MRYPSIRLRLLLGTGLVLMVMLTLASVTVYRAFERTMSGEVESQLVESALLLAKSSELEVDGLVYEWEEAMSSPGTSQTKGLFTFWDLKSDRKTKSPDLGDGDLPFFHGVLNEPVLRDINLPDGRPAKAVGLLHYPFMDQATEAHMAKTGKILRPESYPQVLVCAREVRTLQGKLAHMRLQLTRATVAMLLVTWGAIFAISTWCLRPIRDFSRSLTNRGGDSLENQPAEIPDKLPSELVGLAGAFNTALMEVEQSRGREKEFVLHAAHELRTPVAGIAATLEQAILRPREAPDLVRRIHEALGITSGMRLTLDSLMRLARLRGGLQSGPKNPFDPLSVIRDVLEPLKVEAQGRQLELQVNLPTGHLLLNNDEGLFRMLVSNLADNAVHYAPAGGKVTFCVEANPLRFLFRSRNGRGGLTDQDLARIFEPFQRGNREESEREGHAGLGLSLAREAAHLLGGRLHAEIEGDFVIFTVTLLR